MKRMLLLFAALRDPPEVREESSGKSKRFPRLFSLAKVFRRKGLMFRIFLAML
jgi:hypothetical protein